MVDAFAIDEGQDSWQAMPAPAQTVGGFDAMPMQEQFDMSAQPESASGQPLDDVDFPVSAQAAPVLLQTASGATQSLDDDLTEEERSIVA